MTRYRTSRESILKAYSLLLLTVSSNNKRFTITFQSKIGTPTKSTLLSLAWRQIGRTLLLAKVRTSCAAGREERTTGAAKKRLRTADSRDAMVHAVNCVVMEGGSKRQKIFGGVSSF